ncbi:hypothetical protein [Schlesneria paludicola]|uniref:hypothetical protein n=1 Tax=Schlesneria paludicola TaxID=360056 RepID=UPI00029AC63A|nr:hypothetical protein [Schlesneria paludicola]
MVYVRSILVLAILIAVMRIATPLLFSGAQPVREDQLQEIVYVDTKSGESFLLRARNSPEAHPGTGEPTLVPGMYCEKCQAWKPVGSMEQLQTGNGTRNCPVHKTPLVREGPLPERF